MEFVCNLWNKYNINSSPATVPTNTGVIFDKTLLSLHILNRSFPDLFSFCASCYFFLGCS